MPKILGIETTGEKCSISLFDDTQVIASAQNKEPNSHSAVLHEMIQKLLEQNNIRISELNAIALSKGPGSYTGLRIGSSSVKGLCIACNIPLISIATHEAMLYDTNVLEKRIDFEHLYCLTDARRDDVFCSHYLNNKLIGKINVLNLSDSEVQAQMNTNTSLIIGSGAQKAKQYIGAQHSFIESNCLHASNLRASAIYKYDLKQFEDIAHFEPAYEKEFYVIPSKKKLIS